MSRIVCSVTLCLFASQALATPRFVTPSERTANLDPRDGDDPFDSRIELNWYMQGESSSIGQEGINSTSGNIDVQKVLTYTSKKQVIEPRLNIGLFSRMLLSVELPIILSWQQEYTAVAAYRNAELMYQGVARPTPDDTEYTYPYGVPPSQRTPSASMAEGYSATYTSHRASTVGDLKLSLAFDVLSEIADPSKPTWNWHFGIQLPTADAWTPSFAGADTDGARDGNTATNALANSPGGVSEGVYRATARTVLARWVGKVRPYFAVDYSFGWAKDDAYDSYNLFASGYPDGDFPVPGDHLRETCNVTGDGMVHARCRHKKEQVAGKDNTLDFGAGLVPDHIGGTEFGVSGTLWKTGGSQGSYVKADMLLRAEYHSEGRTLNRLSDLFGRPTFQEQFARIGLNGGLRFATAGILEARLLGSIGSETSHFATFEDIGKADDSDPSDATAADEMVGTINHAYEYSPYFREAYDGVGNRFKLLDSTFYSISADLRIRF
jgi:hypothetical protein